MRKTMAVTALASFLLFLLAGYYISLWIGERDKQLAAMMESRDVLQTQKEINAQTKMIYQYFYTGDRVTKEQIETAPDFLLGLNLEQLKSVYNGWQVVLFSPERVILRCSIEGMSSESFLLGEDEGYLAVFYEDKDKTIHLKERTELPLSALPDGEAKQIREGIRVTGEENLAKLLSDYMS